MRREFLYPRHFTLKWAELGLQEEDLSRLEIALVDDPTLGLLLEGTGGARRMCFSTDGAVRRRTVHVLYVDFEAGETVVALEVYEPYGKATLTPEERVALQGYIGFLSGLFEKKSGRRSTRLYDGVMESVKELMQASVDSGGEMIRHQLSIEDEMALTSEDVRRIREGAGMSEISLAKALGVTPRVVASWENGQSCPGGSASRLLAVMRRTCMGEKNAAERGKYKEEIRMPSSGEILQTRKNANMTQRMFARTLAVPLRTVEAWESGRGRPDGSACRLIGLIRSNPRFADETGIVSR